MTDHIEKEERGGWRDYIRVSGLFSDIDRLILESELDKLYREVPEFRLMFPDIKEVAKNQWQGKAVIRPSSKLLNGGHVEATGKGVFWSNGVLKIDPQAFKDMEYVGTDGELHPFSLTRVLLHGFISITDPAFQYLASTQGDEAQKALGSIPRLFEDFLFERGKVSHKLAHYQWALKQTQEALEPYNIEKTNHLMFRHYGEPFLDEAYHGLVIENSFWSKKIIMGDDIYKPKRNGTTHEETFTSLPILDQFDQSQDRSIQAIQAIQTFRKCLEDKEWEEHARQYEEQKDKKFGQKYDEIEAERKIKLDEAIIQRKDHRNRSWKEDRTERRGNGGSPER